jgi:hypothetical protein
MIVALMPFLIVAGLLVFVYKQSYAAYVPINYRHPKPKAGTIAAIAILVVTIIVAFMVAVGNVLWYALHAGLGLTH